MTRYLAQRLGQSLVVCWAVSVLVFFGVYLIGDPISLLVPPDAGQAAMDHLRQEMGLDRPLVEQYGRFLANLLRGSLGRSFVYREDAIGLVLQRLPATLELAASAMLIALVVGVPAGLYAGAHPDSREDRLVNFGSILAFSVPSFWMGILLILLFAVDLNWLPASGRGATVSLVGAQFSVFTLDGLRHIALPALNLAMFPMGFITRVTRTGMREAINLDFVKFARALGNTRGRIVRRYVLKYVSIPIVTISGIYFGILIAFAVVTESIFSWPGMGKLLIDSILLLDRPVVVAYLLLIVAIILVKNLLIDLIYVALDPRVRIG